MNKEATLFDVALRETFSSGRKVRVPKSIRPTLLAAHRFVLDYNMSAFISDLTNAAFLAYPQRKLEIVDGARRLARLPHPVTWIEYDCRARKIRGEEAYSKVQARPPSGKFDSNNVIPRVGWLCEQHPKLETAFKMTEFVQFDDNHAAMFHHASTWVCDDETVLPWQNDVKFTNCSPAEVASGIFGWKTDKVGITRLFNVSISPGIFEETIGELRATWVVLATINDLPVSYASVRPTKGFTNPKKGYRRFMEHTVIHLNVPAKRSVKTVALRAIVALKRRAHEVRGHWRRDYRHPGERLWVRPHQRGDASRGFVRHDYQVHHEEDK